MLIRRGLNYLHRCTGSILNDSVLGVKKSEVIKNLKDNNLFLILFTEN